MRAGAIAFILVCACYRPQPQEGIACSEQGQCPTPLRCSPATATCVDPDGVGAPDAAPDASPFCPTGTMTFAVTGSIVEYALPGPVGCLATVRIEAWGAQGGEGRAPVQPGGKGAHIAGTFELQGGAMLRILVGGQGLASTNLTSQRGGSGGGGTFVVDASDRPLVVAGGGGGGVGGDFATAEGGPGQAGNDGQMGAGGGAGGTAGAGGATWPNTGYHSATGGGGLLGDGVNDSNGNTTNYGTPNMPGRAFVNGGAGGKGGSQGRDGGFGGGGSAGYTGGGGGGYSGGGGSSSTLVTYAGGGGGSFNAGAAQVSEAGINQGDGRVVISW